MIRGHDEELRDRKYAHVERERRFLVDPAACPDLAELASVLIEDRYIIGTRMRLRRMTDASSGRVVLKLTKKYDVADPLARPIVTTYLDEAEFALLAALPARDLMKRRHALMVARREFGIDVFSGALDGLMLAEIECADAVSLAAVPRPEWVVREVSADPRFEGGRLVETTPTERAGLLVRAPA